MKARNFGIRRPTTVGGVPIHTGVGHSQELDDYNEYNEELAENTIEGFKEGVSLRADKKYNKKSAEEKALIEGQATASEPLKKLEKKFKANARTVGKGIEIDKRAAADAAHLAKKVEKKKAAMDAEIATKMIRKTPFTNSRPLDYSKIKHKKPINTRPKKTLTKGDEMEAAYDNFEKIMGAGNINSLGETTKGLISKQKELLNGIKDMTPVINEAMGVLNKFDLGSILGGIKK